MEATFDSLLCCWVDGNQVDDQEFCFRNKQHDNFRRGRSETFRINVNASFDGNGNRILDINRKKQRDELIDLKDSIAKEKEDTRKRKSRSRSKRREPRS